MTYGGVVCFSLEPRIVISVIDTENPKSKVSTDYKAVLVVYLTDDCHYEDDVVLSLASWIKRFTGSKLVNVGYSAIGGSPVLASI